MDGAGQELFADAGLTVDQDRRVERRDRADQLEDLPHRVRVAENAAEGELLLVALERRTTRSAQFLELDGVADDDEHLGRLEGLHQVVRGAQPHRLDRRLDRTVGRHHDHAELSDSCDTEAFMG